MNLGCLTVMFDCRSTFWSLLVDSSCKWSLFSLRTIKTQPAWCHLSDCVVAYLGINFFNSGGGSSGGLRWGPIWSKQSFSSRRVFRAPPRHPQPPNAGIAPLWWAGDSFHGYPAGGHGSSYLTLNRRTSVKKRSSAILSSQMRENKLIPPQTKWFLNQSAKLCHPTIFSLSYIYFWCVCDPNPNTFEKAHIVLAFQNCCLITLPCFLKSYDWTR